LKWFEDQTVSKEENLAGKSSQSMVLWFIG